VQFRSGFFGPPADGIPNRRAVSSRFRNTFAGFEIQPENSL
jgi:hypothetical protein